MKHRTRSLEISAFDDDALARLAKALAHPARLALLRALSENPSCCGHLVRDLAQREMTLAQSTVSQHLRILVDAGLVTRTACGVESYFNVDAEGLDRALAAFASLRTMTGSLSAEPMMKA